MHVDFVAPGNVGNMKVVRCEGLQLVKFVAVEFHLKFAVLYQHMREIIFFLAPVESGQGSHLRRGQRSLGLGCRGCLRGLLG